MILVKRILKYAAYGVIALVALLYALNNWDDIKYMVAGAGAVYVLIDVLRRNVREIVREELASLKEQGFTNTPRIEETNRKVSEMWWVIERIGKQRV